MKLYIGNNWRLWLGLSLSVFGVLIALLGLGMDMTLTFLALAVLTVSTGLIQLSLWSKRRQCWL
ncbi:MAG: hypothetical protein DMG70_31975 [Acidobacteria bacterium]|nr:MAG: hypothetical protein DMG70_31975 [Acidobacteriota bacterium]PYY11577.1 MAG: hypothetical protein DMG69_03555 [Acidobacteriota bacterium]